ncbi:MAG TPA: S46 family peptidase [Thermoanaerobaculia bacterium]|nr:S46 family peptidase [Thermoanaerobaculia bacterium]
MPDRRPWTALAAALALVLSAPLARADEGMWLFNEFPFERFEAAHGFRPSQELLDHLRLSSIRFGRGGSASFVSPDGLVLTNHHVGSGCIQQLSTAERDLLRDGFVAATRADELPCPSLELGVLESIERVTERIRAAERGAADATAAGDARRAEIAAIEKACADSTGLRCDVVTLYSGGEYDLYRFRRYTDVRLAFAPEAQLANFGGDDDNFEYPRYAIDFSLFRAYENGEPARPEHWLRWGRDGVAEGDVLFLIGNPGSTGRLLTVAQLEFLRDTAYPGLLALYNHTRTLLYEFSARGEEQARIANDDIDGVENGIKAISGYMSGLLDPDLMARKASEEASLRAAVAADPELAARTGDPWTEIETAMAAHRSFLARQYAVERGIFRASDLMGHAQRLIRLATEREKPNGERLPEYRDTAIPAMERRIGSTAPIYPEYEAFLLGQGLRGLLAQLGPVHPVVRKLLGERTPEAVAEAAVAGTKLADPEVRKQLMAGGRAALAAAEDPILALAELLEPLARELVDREQNEVESVEDLAGARVAEAFFAIHGRETYPDATFTPRVSFAPVRGWTEDGVEIPYTTRFGGYFERSEKFGGRPPFDLPPGLAAAREKLDLATPVDFLTTHDIIGGNSGSPVVDREGEFVGIVFDGNLYMLPNRFAYQDETSRAISVDARAILATLTAIYPAGHLAEEILNDEGP